MAISETAISETAISERDVIEGLGVGALSQTAELIGIPIGELVQWVHISPRTFSRRKVAGSLDVVESDRVARAVRLYERAVDVLGSADGARTWLHSANPALDRRTPWQVARTEIGADRVFNLLGRLEHGVLG